MVTKALKEVTMRDVKLFIVLILILCNGCSSKPKKDGLVFSPTDNDGGYTLKPYYSNGKPLSDTVIVFGKIEDLDEATPLPNSIIEWGCVDIFSDDNGYYRMKVYRDLDVSFLLSVRHIGGFRRIVTKSILLENLDSIQANFYLDPYIQIFSDCAY